MSKPGGWIGYGLHDKPYGVEDSSPRRAEKVKLDRPGFSVSNAVSRADLYFDRASYVCPKQFAAKKKKDGEEESSSEEEEEEEEEENEESPEGKALSEEEKAKAAAASAGGAGGAEAGIEGAAGGLSLDEKKKEEGDEKYDYVPLERPDHIPPELADELQRAVNAFALWNRWCTLPRKRFEEKIKRTPNCPVTVEDVDLLAWNWNGTVVNHMEMGDTVRKAAKYNIRANVGYA